MVAQGQFFCLWAILLGTNQDTQQSTNRLKSEEHDEGVDERLKDMHESVNRNMYIALI
jgi:hypothetical protein